MMYIFYLIKEARYITFVKSYMLDIGIFRQSHDLLKIC